MRLWFTWVASVWLASPAFAAPIDLVVAPGVDPADAKRIGAIFEAHGVDTAVGEGPLSRCDATDGIAACVGLVDDALTLAIHRSKASGGAGTALRARLEGDYEASVWSLWKRARVARQVSAERAGRVSVDGGPLKTLPLAVPYREAPLELLVQLDDCPPFVAHLAPDDDRRVLECPPVGNRLRLTGPASTVTARVELDDRVEERAVVAHETWDLALAPEVRSVTVTCDAPGALTWQQRYTFDGPGDRAVKCEPVDAGRFIVVSSNVTRPVIQIDRHVVSRYIPVPSRESRPVLPGEDASTFELQAGQWAALDAHRPGSHVLCISGPEHQRTCKKVEYTPGEPARLSVAAPPRRIVPPPQCEDGSTPPCDDRPGPGAPSNWQLQLGSTFGVDSGRDTDWSMATDVMTAYRVGRWGLGLGMQLLNNEIMTGWGAGGRVTADVGELRLMTGFAFRQLAEGWDATDAIYRQIYTAEVGVDYPLAAGFSLRAVGEAGAEERRTRDFSAARLATENTFGHHLSLRGGIAWAWRGEGDR